MPKHVVIGNAKRGINAIRNHKMNKLSYRYTNAQQRKDLKPEWDDNKPLCKAYWSMAFILSALLWVGVGKLFGWC
ncbi:TMhelix containing protein [Vibrio phage 1.029.O._10N.261.55.A7]|nr:TMhelix containing protein [Vibrio phage 1.029.O._10N.261.55.A7]